jgi:hypothetical protein
MLRFFFIIALVRVRIKQIWQGQVGRELGNNILQMVDLALDVLLPDRIAFQDHLQAFVDGAW